MFKLFVNYSFLAATLLSSTTAIAAADEELLGDRAGITRQIGEVELFVVGNIIVPSALQTHLIFGDSDIPDEELRALLPALLADETFTSSLAGKEYHGNQPGLPASLSGYRPGNVLSEARKSKDPEVQALTLRCVTLAPWSFMEMKEGRDWLRQNLRNPALDADLRQEIITKLREYITEGVDPWRAAKILLQIEEPEGAELIIQTLREKMVLPEPLEDGTVLTDSSFPRLAYVFLQHSSDETFKKELLRALQERADSPEFSLDKLLSLAILAQNDPKQALDRVLAFLDTTQLQDPEYWKAINCQREALRKIDGGEEMAEACRLWLVDRLDQVKQYLEDVLLGDDDESQSSSSSSSVFSSSSEYSSASGGHWVFQGESYFKFDDDKIQRILLICKLALEDSREAIQLRGSQFLQQLLNNHDVPLWSLQYVQRIVTTLGDNCPPPLKETFLSRIEEGLKKMEFATVSENFSNILGFLQLHRGEDMPRIVQEILAAGLTPQYCQELRTFMTAHMPETVGPELDEAICASYLRLLQREDLSVPLWDVNQIASFAFEKFAEDDLRRAELLNAIADYYGRFLTTDTAQVTANDVTTIVNFLMHQLPEDAPQHLQLLDAAAERYIRLFTIEDSQATSNDLSWSIALITHLPEAKPERAQLLEAAAAQYLRLLGAEDSQMSAHDVSQCISFATTHISEEDPRRTPLLEAAAAQYLRLLGAEDSQMSAHDVSQCISFATTHISEEDPRRTPLLEAAAAQYLRLLEVEDSQMSAYDVSQCISFATTHLAEEDLRRAHLLEGAADRYVRLLGAEDSQMSAYDVSQCISFATTHLAEEDLRRAHLLEGAADRYVRLLGAEEIDDYSLDQIIIFAKDVLQEGSEPRTAILTAVWQYYQQKLLMPGNLNNSELTKRMLRMAEISS